MSLPDALTQLARSRNELACIVDEYGGFAGVLTMEDLAEELVGELTDEHDDAPSADIEPEQEDMWRMAGDVHVDEVERAVGYELPDGDFETISGLLIAHRGELLTSGETVRLELPDDPRDLVLDRPVRRALDVEVLEVSRHVPSELRLRLVETSLDGTELSDDIPARDEAASEEDR